MLSTRQLQTNIQLHILECDHIKYNLTFNKINVLTLLNNLFLFRSLKPQLVELQYVLRNSNNIKLNEVIINILMALNTESIDLTSSHLTANIPFNKYAFFNFILFLFYIIYKTFLQALLLQKLKSENTKKVNKCKLNKNLKGHSIRKRSTDIEGRLSLDTRLPHT